MVYLEVGNSAAFAAFAAQYAMHFCYALVISDRIIVHGAHPRESNPRTFRLQGDYSNTELGGHRERPAVVKTATPAAKCALLLLSYGRIRQPGFSFACARG